MGDLAAEASPLSGGVKLDTEPDLVATNYFRPAVGATAIGLHAILIEVNPEIFDVDILKYDVVHDCGRVIDPLILDGQIHGGGAQGIGDASHEELSTMKLDCC